MQTRQTVLILTLFFLMGLFVARLPATVAQLRGGGSYEFFDPIIDVYSTISRAYVDEPDKLKLQIGAINGMLDALEDPYTEFVPPADRALFQKELTGQFVGIGAEVVTEGGYLTIVSPLEDSPAIAAGIRAGDRVTEIDGQSTLNKTVDECVDMLAGEPGTQVTLTVERNAGVETLKITVTRGHIVPRAVRGVHRHAATASSNGAAGGGGWDYMLDPERKIAYIRLTQFTPTAADELTAALKQIRADEPGAVGGLILDLRGDPGGVLEGALAVADLFLKEGVIVTVKGRTSGGGGAGDEVYTAKAPGTLPDFPLIVLVNGASASASEIVAGALADHGRAIVLGTRTFGKGLVQAVQTLSRPVWGGALGAQLKFTSQRYYLPSGRLIHRTDDATTWGVDPTPGFYVPLTSEEQLARILERRSRDVLVVGDDPHTQEPAVGGGADEPRWADPDWIETSLKDKQLAAAVRAMRERLASGQWKPVSEAVASAEDQVEQVSSTELRNLQLGRERMLRELARIERRIETLESTLVGDAIPEPDFDLWPDDAPIAGGRLQVYDKDGKLVATLNITGQNLERWLIDAGVEPSEPQAGGNGDKADAQPPVPQP